MDPTRIMQAESAARAAQHYAEGLEEELKAFRDRVAKLLRAAHTVSLESDDGREERHVAAWTHGRAEAAAELLQLWKETA